MYVVLCCVFTMKQELISPKNFDYENVITQVLRKFYFFLHSSKDAFKSYDENVHHALNRN